MKKTKRLSSILFNTKTSFMWQLTHFKPFIPHCRLNLISFLLCFFLEILTNTRRTQSAEPYGPGDSSAVQSNASITQARLNYIQGNQDVIDFQTKLGCRSHTPAIYTFSLSLSHTHTHTHSKRL